MRRCIAAWTAINYDSYPPYISINEEVEGVISVTARPEADFYGDRSISFLITREELKDLAEQILERLDS